jgi:hypothetical protein
MVGFLSSKPTLTVGPSPNTLGEVINRTGKVAIGDVPVPDIAAKLHIRSDEGEDAGIFVEPKDSSSNTFIRLRDEDHGIEVDNNGDMSITAGDNTMDLQSTNITLTGKVGINIANESDWWDPAAQRIPAGTYRYYFKAHGVTIHTQHTGVIEVLHDK